jgi:predicted metalloprotease with PDZ domain
MEMQISNIPDTFNVAMVAHPEYDDKYWRYVEDFYAKTRNGKGSIIRKDSALWQVIIKGGTAVLHYRIHFPTVESSQRQVWKAFLSSAGGLVGGPHCFMYIMGATLAPSYVTLNIPNGWQAVTGLTTTSDPNTFFASSVFILIDDPIMIGKIKSWSFSVDGVPHRVVYWPWPVKDFDTTKLVSGTKKFVEQAVLLFGRPPYREYSFMLQDGAFGSLEHNNSVTIGAPVEQLTNNLTGVFSDIAHEYFHTWNLVRIHPVEYADVDYKTPALSKGLWFSEGLTIFYADLLRRRAGLPTFDSTRIKRLEGLIRRYVYTPAYLKFSAEQISLASYGPTGMLGDYSASTHLQGEVLGAMLDIIIRDATNGKRSMDDVMRKMMERYSGKKGFTSHDIEQTISDVCSCDLRSFFQDYLFGKKPVDFDKYLRSMGMQKTLTWKDVMTDGKPSPDLRIYVWQAPNETALRVGITDPSSCWGKAGLHTGDILKSVNDTIVKTAVEFRQQLRTAKIGDTIIVEVQRPTGTKEINVVVAGYKQPEVQITEINDATEKQKRLLAQWKTGN